MVAAVSQRVQGDVSPGFETVRDAIAHAYGALAAGGRELGLREETLTRPDPSTSTPWPSMLMALLEIQRSASCRSAEIEANEEGLSLPGPRSLNVASFLMVELDIRLGTSPLVARTWPAPCSPAIGLALCSTCPAIFRPPSRPVPPGSSMLGAEVDGRQAAEACRHHHQGFRSLECCHDDQHGPPAAARRHRRSGVDRQTRHTASALRCILPAGLCSSAVTATCYRVKLMVTVMTTGTGTPLRSVGV